MLDFALNIKVFEMDHVLQNTDLYSSIRKLTISPNSGMNLALNSFELESSFRKINAKAIIAYKFDDAVGWALYSKDIATDIWRFDPVEGTICFQVFVNRKNRRQGIGSQLLRKAIELAGNDTIKVYETDAPDFFKIHQSCSKNITSIYNKTL